MRHKSVSGATCALALLALAGCGSTKTIIIQNHTSTVTSTTTRASTSASTTSASTSNPIYFYAAPALVADPQVSPQRITFAADGNFEVTALRWRGWGTRLATGDGIDHVNNCTPDCATGQVEAIPVQVELYQLGVRKGLNFYLCSRVASVVKIARKPEYCFPTDTGRAGATNGQAAVLNAAPGNPYPKGWARLAVRVSSLDPRWAAVYITANPGHEHQVQPEVASMYLTKEGWKLHAAHGGGCKVPLPVVRELKLACY